MSIISLPLSLGANAFFSAFTKWIVGGAQSVLTDLLDEIMAPTTVGLGSGDWFTSVAGVMFPLEEFLVAPLLLAATIGAILRQDMRRLARAWGVYLPISMLAGGAVVELTRTGLQFTDQFAVSVQQLVLPNLQNILATDIGVGIVSTIADGPFAAALSLLVLLGALAIWLELVLRATAIELAVFFMPLALAGLVWPATAHWAKRLIEVLVALMLAKPVIVGALCLGGSALQDVSNPGAAVSGVAILLMAAFAPMALLKLVPLVEVSAIAHLEGLSRRPFQAAERGVHRVMGAVTPAASAAAAATAAVGVEGGAAGLSGVAGLSGSAGHYAAQVGQSTLSEAEQLGPGATPKFIPAQSAPTLTNTSAGHG
ncbi:MAG TPA: hypothetical protein VN786_11145 [Acidimicrobiales bacterium]|nr:hypothetical protein [Acidimicrobiales bacterium]